MIQIVTRSPKSSCKKVRDILRLKDTAISSSTVSRRFSKTIWTEVLQAVIKAIPNTSDEDKESGLCQSGRRKEMFYLTTHSTYFIYGYMASAGVEEMHHAVVCTSLHA